MTHDTGSDTTAGWYYAVGGEQRGPVARAELLALRALGSLTADSLVWHPSLTSWLPCSEALGEAASETNGGVEAGQDGTVACSVCSRSFAPDDVITLSGATLCADCKSLYLQATREGALLPGALQYAGFWPRLGAKVIDWLLLGIANLVVYYFFGMAAVTAPADFSAYFLVQGVLALAQYAIGATYTTYFLGSFGATPGKMLLQLRVVAADGGKVSYLRALGRYFAELLSGLILYIGYLVAAFDAERRAMHDHLCATRVVYAVGSGR